MVLKRIEVIEWKKEMFLCVQQVHSQICSPTVNNELWRNWCANKNRWNTFTYTNNTFTSAHPRNVWYIYFQLKHQLYSAEQKLLRDIIQRISQYSDNSLFILFMGTKLNRKRQFLYTANAIITDPRHKEAHNRHLHRCWTSTLIIRFGAASSKAESGRSSATQQSN